MLRPPALSTSSALGAVARTIEETRESVETGEQLRIELRLTLMETKVRIAELKATLRRLPR